MLEKTGWVKEESALNEELVNSEMLVFYENKPGGGNVGRERIQLRTREGSSSRCHSWRYGQKSASESLSEVNPKQRTCWASKEAIPSEASTTTYGPKHPQPRSQTPPNMPGGVMESSRPCFEPQPHYFLAVRL